MRSFFIYASISVICLHAISSCKKDVLDKEPLNGYSDPAVWRDAGLTETFINNTYRIMPHGFIVDPSRVLALACVSDEAYKRGGEADYINSGNITAANLGIMNTWTIDFIFPWLSEDGLSYWKVITKCNIFFDKIGTSTIDENTKQGMIGQMKFLRAYAYSRLVAFYGGVPLISKPFTLNDDFSIPRNTYDECINFIVSELDEAANLLPLDYDAANKGKITKGAALAIKSRVLLYDASPLNNPSNDVAKWQKAADAAKAVIDLNHYSLYPNYKELFYLANSYNSEIIYSRPFNFSVDPEDTYMDLSLYPNGYNGFGQVHPLQNVVDDYEMTNGEIPVSGYTSTGTPIVNPASGYDPQNPYVNRDPRFYASILYDGAPFKDRPVETFLPGGKDSNEGALSPWNATLTGYYFRKFLDETITNPSGQNNSNPPWIFCRYAEILLNYAEAMYNLGDEPACREYINMVRSRPGVDMPAVTQSGAALLKRLQNERRIELVFEGYRYFDVRRWKIAPEVLSIPGRKMSVQKNINTGVKTYTVSDFNPRAFNERNYLLPIPQSEIDKNPLLQQNEGY